MNAFGPGLQSGAFPQVITNVAECYLFSAPMRARDFDVQAPPELASHVTVARQCVACALQTLSHNN